MNADRITPFVFDSLPVRGALISLSRAWRRMLRDHDYAALVTETLGHAAAARRSLGGRSSPPMSPLRAADTFGHSASVTKGQSRYQP